MSVFKGFQGLENLEKKIKDFQGPARALINVELYCLMTEARILTTCPGLHSTVGQLGFEPATYVDYVK